MQVNRTQRILAPIFPTTADSMIAEAAIVCVPTSHNFEFVICVATILEYFRKLHTHGMEPCSEQFRYTPFSFEQKTFQLVAARTAVARQRRLATKLENPILAKRVIDDIRQDGAALVQSKRLTLWTRRTVTLVTLVDPVFSAAAAFVLRKTLKQQECMVMAFRVKMLSSSLSLLIIISGCWIWIWIQIRHERGAVRPISPLTKC